MASFLAGLAAAATKVGPLPDMLSKPVGARALQAKLSTELGGVGPRRMLTFYALTGDIRRRERICIKCLPNASIPM